MKLSERNRGLWNTHKYLRVAILKGTRKIIQQLCTFPIFLRKAGYRNSARPIFFLMQYTQTSSLKATRKEPCFQLQINDSNYFHNSYAIHYSLLVFCSFIDFCNIATHNFDFLPRYFPYLNPKSQYHGFPSSIPEKETMTCRECISS